LDAGTTVHGHGTNITFLNATEIETELRESVLGACDSFIPAPNAADPPLLGMDKGMGMAVFSAVAVCVLFAAFFVMRRSNDDRNTVKALEGSDKRGIDNPLYDATTPSMGMTNPGFAGAGYSSSESEDDTENSGYLEVSSSGGSLTAGAGSSRKERRASKKAAKKAKKAGSSDPYYGSAFDSPLPEDGGFDDVGGYADVPGDADAGLYDDFGADADANADDRSYNHLSGSAVENADDEGDADGFAEDAPYDSIE